ncbi:LysR family transcriptional regulator for metE and metH [Mucilaginibacter frigoritolerans]|uniref:LysR family transcriptional regulator for metE and metH n=1 Tax=Mucilaginibacter frigoritolerans TaxID=652788 RepID=A0A562TR26_9SPHI|nr:LysR family transcriptional regulator [Mucilaginibacter frigoritolerans]TWI95893.1 LysR family transcriptional regulator for metE and metH [Mucilaginibacter frigoritolerans]
MNIALHHFRLVDTISKEGTLTKAAKTLHLTQSALSHQLKELERELDVEIFDRQGKRLHLSEQGYRFLRSAEKILAELKTLEEDINNYKNGKTGKLSISMQCYTAYHWLPGIIKYYKKRWPDINIQILSDATRRPLEYLMNGDLDIGIIRTQMVNTKIRYEPIFVDRLTAVICKDHPLAKKDVINISDFHGEELILPLYDPSYQDTPVIEALIQAQQVKPKTLHRIHYTDAAIEMVNAGLGITVMADWIVEPYLKGRNIVTKPLHHSVAKRAWYAATCKQTPAILNFLECLKMYFAGEDMSVDEPEKKIIIQEHVSPRQKSNVVASVGAKFINEPIASSVAQDIKSYQY